MSNTRSQDMVAEAASRLIVALDFPTADEAAEMASRLRGHVGVFKIGLELIVSVDTHKRTIVLPGALAGYKPTSATLEEGSLTVGFEHG